MDPKKNLTGLDPQLKATYDRIMAVPTTSTPNQPVQQYIPPTPVRPIAVAQPGMQNPSQPPQRVIPQQIQRQVTRPTYAAGKFATGAPIIIQEKKSGHAFLISSIIAGIILFGIYILFWLQFFNIPVGY